MDALIHGYVVSDDGTSLSFMSVLLLTGSLVFLGHEFIAVLAQTNKNMFVCILSASKFFDVLDIVM